MVILKKKLGGKVLHFQTLHDMQRTVSRCYIDGVARIFEGGAVGGGCGAFSRVRYSADPRVLAGIIARTREYRLGSCNKVIRFNTGLKIKFINDNVQVCYCWLPYTATDIEITAFNRIAVKLDNVFIICPMAFESYLQMMIVHGYVSFCLRVIARVCEYRCVL